jgi:hypothetical protein
MKIHLNSEGDDHRCATEAQEWAKDEGKKDFWLHPLALFRARMRPAEPKDVSPVAFDEENMAEKKLRIYG